MLKRISSHPVGSTVIAGVILAVIGYLAKFIPGFYPSILGGIKRGWNWVFSTTPIPNWLWITMAIATLIFIVAILRELLVSNKNTQEISEYCKDDVFGVVWRWEYSGNQIFNLYSFCPRCDIQIFPSMGVELYDDNKAFSIFHCGNCNEFETTVRIDPDDLNREVTLQVHRKLRTGLWVETLKNDK